MPMKTESPWEPAGQVPIGGWLSAARATAGKALAASRPVPALRTARRDGFNVSNAPMVPPLSLPIGSGDVPGPRDCGTINCRRGRPGLRAALAPNCPDAPRTERSLVDANHGRPGE